MNDLKINWTNSENYSFFNPRLPQEQRSLIQSNLKLIDLSGHLFLSTSGTSGKIKIVALSKRAFLCSAAAVNRHLNITQEDRWLNVLPHFHVGGLGIFARASEAGSSVFDYSYKSWDPVFYSEALTTYRATWSSLVPAQVFDLISREIPSPSQLKGIIVGGGHLSEDLHRKASLLGWPLFLSYGMTECCSQIATAMKHELHSPLCSLPHVELKINDNSIIEVKSPSLLTGYLLCDLDNPTFIDPKREGWFTTEDKGTLENGVLKIMGRGENFIKIGGEGIDFSFLEKKWEEVCLMLKLDGSTALIDLPDDRLGRSVHLATEKNEKLEQGIALYNSKVLPNAKIRQVHTVAEIPRSPLKKILKEHLRTQLTVNQANKGSG